MMRSPLLTLIVAASAVVALAGCYDETAPRDVTPPAAPRGVFSVTGDHSVTLHWLANTEPDLAAYRIYTSACSHGPDCPYEPVAVTVGTQFVVSGLANGETRYFAVAAIDRSGNESDLSYDDVFDTPRPAGSVALTNASTAPAAAGYDFSAFTVRRFDDPQVDIYYVNSTGTDWMVAPFQDTQIQDAGYAQSLDAVDFAPVSGWSPSGSVELVLGHCYIVYTHENHYAKFRVTGFGPAGVEMDWAYQVDPGNRELKARHAVETKRVPRTGSGIL